MQICTYSLIIQLQKQTMQDLIKALKALSDETRLRILKILLEKECCVCEVMQALDISQSRASHNLRILQDAGFVKSRRDGAWIVYSVDWQTTHSHAISLTELLKNSSLGDQILAQDQARLKRAKRIGPGCRKAQVR